MKLSLLVTSLVILSTRLFASGLHLGWDPSPTSGVTNYTVYAGTNSFAITNSLVKVQAGTNTTAEVTDIQPGKWWFTATAWKDGVESDPADPLHLEVPEPPEHMINVVVQFSGSLSNFYDVGFFKLRMPAPSP